MGETMDILERQSRLVFAEATFRPNGSQDKLLITKVQEFSSRMKLRPDWDAPPLPQAVIRTRRPNPLPEFQAGMVGMLEIRVADALDTEWREIVMNAQYTGFIAHIHDVYMCFDYYQIGER